MITGNKTNFIRKIICIIGIHKYYHKVDWVAPTVSFNNRYCKFCGKEHYNND